jgi:hypothetical protein
MAKCRAKPLEPLAKKYNYVIMYQKGVGLCYLLFKYYLLYNAIIIHYN